MFHQMMSHQLFANISQQVALLTLVAVANWAPKWHKMHWFKIWLSGGATCNPYPILYYKLQIWHHLPHITLDCPFGIV